jgi:hypothetical protein
MGSDVYIHGVWSILHTCLLNLGSSSTVLSWCTTVCTDSYWWYVMGDYSAVRVYVCIPPTPPLRLLCTMTWYCEIYTLNSVVVWRHWRMWVLMYGQNCEVYRRRWRVRGVSGTHTELRLFSQPPSCGGWSSPQHVYVAVWLTETLRWKPLPFVEDREGKPRWSVMNWVCSYSEGLQCSMVLWRTLHYTAATSMLQCVQSRIEVQYDAVQCVQCFAVRCSSAVVQ